MAEKRSVNAHNKSESMPSLCYCTGDDLVPQFNVKMSSGSVELFDT